MVPFCFREAKLMAPVGALPDAGAGRKTPQGNSRQTGGVWGGFPVGFPWVSLKQVLCMWFFRWFLLDLGGFPGVVSLGFLLNLL